MTLSFLPCRYLFLTFIWAVCLGIPFFGFSFPTFAQESAPIEAVAAPQESEQKLVDKEGDQKTPESEPEKEVASVSTLTKNKDVEDMLRRIQFVKPKVQPSQIPSLFFTSWEQNLLAEARRGLNARRPTDSEVNRAQRDFENGTPPPVGPRELSLGGIVFVSADDWTIWLNKQKITPKRIPPEILDIRVRKDYVELKWFDAYTNQIFPIKLKTHQRFNIDARIFLQG